MTKDDRRDTIDTEPKEVEINRMNKDVVEAFITKHTKKGD